MACIINNSCRTNLYTWTVLRLALSWLLASSPFDGNGDVDVATWPTVRSQLETHEPGLGLIWHWLRHLSATFQKQFARHKSLKCPNSFATEQFDLLASKYSYTLSTSISTCPTAMELRFPHRAILIARVFAIPCNCFKCCFSSSLRLWSIFVASFIIGKNWFFVFARTEITINWANVTVQCWPPPAPSTFLAAEQASLFPLAELSYSRTWYVADMAAIPERCQVTGAIAAYTTYLQGTLDLLHLCLCTRPASGHIVA